MLLTGWMLHVSAERHEGHGRAVHPPRACSKGGSTPVQYNKQPRDLRGILWDAVQGSASARVRAYAAAHVLHAAGTAVRAITAGTAWAPAAADWCHEWDARQGSAHACT